MPERALAIVAATLLCACNGGSSPAPVLPDPGEPNNTVEDVLVEPPLAVGAPVTATITAETDYDFHAVEVPADGATLRFQTFDATGAACGRRGDPGDTFVEIYDAAASRLAWSDDSWAGLEGAGTGCEDFTFALPAGTAYVAVSGYPPYPFVYTFVVTIP